MALEGTLRDFSFADILQLISLQRKTGVLTLKRDDNVVTLSFLDGCIVGASSLNQHTEDRIGLILLKRGEVTETELEAALRRQEETLQRLGRILIDHHVVSEQVVREALEQQILQIVYRVFRWSDGEYHFSQETDIDYDRDLMVPMAADSIIMEGARMTDEWPFIDQRIPDREAVFIQVDPGRRFEVVDEREDDFDDLGFSFTDSPEESRVEVFDDSRLSRNQSKVYQLVNGRDSVAELILESPLIEFETCKALADLVDRGLIREATQEEIARSLAREVEPVRRSSVGTAAIPWLAIPFLVLLGFSLTVMVRNPLNPGITEGPGLWSRFVEVSSSWMRMDRLARYAERHFLITGLYPDDVDDLVESGMVPQAATLDPWERPYRMVTRGTRLLVTGSDRDGEPMPLLIITRPLAWEGEAGGESLGDRPGVVLIP
jgi:hypothetical protein